MAAQSFPYKEGDVILTNPAPSYWGCAVVLKCWENIRPFGPMCHIATTSIVMRREFTLSDIEISQLDILAFDRGHRIGPMEYVYRRESMIEIYTLVRGARPPVIGSVNPRSVFPHEITFVVGDGANGGFPLCGQIKTSLGMEAVIAWRAQHEREQWLSEVEAARRETEEVLASLKNDESERRPKRAAKSGSRSSNSTKKAPKRKKR
jgi:hypothetical protein